MTDAASIPITTRFWYTNAMVQGSDLTWEWKLFGVSGKV
jgi:hypothetical protein